jgi:dihydroneopterin triphosphate diphosphatase
VISDGMGLRPDAVGVVVLRGTGDVTRILLIRRGRGAFAGAWTIVMGGIEPGERATETARREVLEETGLAVAALYTAGALDTFYDPVKDSIVVVPFFVARVADGDVRTDAAHDAHRWVHFDEALPLLTFSAQRRLLEEVRVAFVEREPEAWRTIS